MRVQSESVFTPGQRRVYAVLTALWVAANLVFWLWWLRPERVGDPLLYVLLTIAWAYEATFLPSMYLFFVGRMRQPRPVPAPGGLRVALITLCVPAQETLEVIEEQLAAMGRVTYPHDSWVLDEGDDPAVRAAAERHGVRYFSRRGVARYNQPIPPFKAKTKAGNVNAWLDSHGGDYDFFVQFDIDHRPRPEYLDSVLGYFGDKHVAWVQAPSLYGNLDSWVARGAAEQELVLQGPLQRGFFGHSETPFIIGSHSTYRTSAIREIGGFQPTRAEDHLDTVMLAARGYRGVFVPRVLALGHGPETFETYLRQQFAWALSMMQVLLGFSPRVVRSCNWRQGLQFLFAQTWYPLWSTSMLVLFAMPLLALVTGREPARSPLSHFALASGGLTLTAFGVWRWTRRWQLPHGLGLSWRGMVLHVARWPIVFWALLNVLLRVRHPYMITPKGERTGLPAFPLRTQAIYLLGAALGLGAVWQYLLRDVDTGVDGYALFGLLGVVYMLGVVLTNVGADLLGLWRRGLGFGRMLRLRAAPVLTVCVGLASLAGTACATHDALLTAATWTSEAPGAGATPGAVAARQVLEGSRGMDEAAPPAVEAWLPFGPSEPSRAASPAQADGRPDAALAQLDDPEAPPLVGAYDPWQDGRELDLGIDHWYIRQDDAGLFAAALDQDPGRIPLITIEPFPRRGRGPVLQRVIAGGADQELERLARVVAERPSRVVLVRWGHEMDLGGLYPWAANDPEQYRAAFRHVVSVFRAAGAVNARWVWSPAGEPGAKAYYPGDDVVDYVGLTVLGDAEWDWDMGYPTPRAMADLLRPRYAEVAGLDKPVLLAELGTSGSPDEQQAWLAAGLAGLGEFDRLRALVYFDDRNAPNNRRPTEPDWRVGPAGLAAVATSVDADRLPRLGSAADTLPLASRAGADCC